MKVAVWDTYVKRSNGSIMHFDILVPSNLTSESKILNFGNDYLKSKSFKTGKLSAKECTFCHIENVVHSIVEEIQNKGFYIIEMENCN
jgi:hypothetical protein